MFISYKIMIDSIPNENQITLYTFYDIKMYLAKFSYRVLSGLLKKMIYIFMMN